MNNSDMGFYVFSLIIWTLNGALASAIWGVTIGFFLSANIILCVCVLHVLINKKYGEVVEDA